MSYLAPGHFSTSPPVLEANIGHRSKELAEWSSKLMQKKKILRLGSAVWLQADYDD